MELTVSRITDNDVLVETIKGVRHQVPKDTQVYHYRGHVYVSGVGAIKKLFREVTTNVGKVNSSTINYNPIQDINQVDPSIIKYHEKLQRDMVKGANNTMLQHTLDTQNSARIEYRDKVAVLYMQDRFNCLYGGNPQEFQNEASKVAKRAYILADLMLKHKGNG